MAKTKRAILRNRFGRIIFAHDMLFFWEEYFTIMKQDLENSSSPYILICNKTGAHLAQGDSPEALNEPALKELDKIFENNVLLSR